MYAQMFRESPLLIMPLVSLVFFFAVFVAVVFRFLTKSKSAFDPMAALPLEDGAPLSSHDAIQEVRNVQ